MRFPIPFLKDLQGRKLARVRGGIPSLQSAEDSACLALYEYFSEVPQRFFDRGVYDEYFVWISDASRSQLLAADLVNEHGRLDRAFRVLSEINSQSWHDQIVGDEVDQMLMLDRQVHPAYLRLVEAVLYPFLLLPARVNRRQRGKPTDGLDVFNAVDELKATLPQTTRSYRHRVRNGIGHGGIDFIDDQVVYTDKASKSEEHSPRTVVRLTDDLLDACNAVALAFKVFLLTGTLARDRWPREVLLQELQTSVAAPWWHVTACVPSESAAGRQLNIHVAANTRDYRKAYFSAVQTAALAQHLAPGFARYFLSIRSSKALPGFAAFDGAKLSQVAKDPNAVLARYASALQDGLVFYAPHLQLPSFLGHADTLRLAWTSRVRSTLIDQRQKSRPPDLEVRYVVSHTDPLRVTSGWVVLLASTVEVIRKNARYILRTVVRAEKTVQSLVPSGLVQVSVFDHDFRCRRLNGFGLGSALVCTLTLSRDPRKRVPNLAGSRVEIIDGVRICWNTNWPKLGAHLADAELAG